MRRAAITTVVAALALAMGAWAATAKGPPEGGVTPVPGTFELSGSVEGLYPGSHTLLDIKVENPYRFEVHVTTLQVTVDDAGSDCPASAIEVGEYAGGTTVPARGEAIVALPTRMLPSAPDACQGATFELTYHAVAEKV